MEVEAAEGELIAEKLVAAIADADGKLQTLSQLLPKKVEEKVAETK